MPAVLKSSDPTDFYKLFELYIDGILSKKEFFKLVKDMIKDNSDEQY